MCHRNLSSKSLLKLIRNYLACSLNREFSSAWRNDFDFLAGAFSLAPLPAISFGPVPACR
ncbi:hypothetical protein PUN28_017522 [Cardiocondyla obscurior]|uniref:Uncharacterized protein n=1 Tax=Cardiocondyla obscurior TaxID=286306 RepID=A0AAW2EIW3_9HYME